ncbi:hypothetical protein XF36_28235 (plasmid) [Pseudonocardia sp. HH130629-09]|nr:hypothetical protein XF36_28235 [Pseudonocardia sp. HH130629-09]
MLATAGRLPDGPDWAYEVKWDGMRTTTAAAGSGLRLRSRNGADLTARYPELAALRLPAGLMLDGEIVALDEQGRSDFALLQRRIQRTQPSPELLSSVPVTLVVFDVVRAAGVLQTGLPYRDRRALLAGLDLPTGPRMSVPDNFTDVASADVLSAVDAQGLEGVVAKRLTSRYEAGRRSRAWIKHAIRRSCLVAVVGWTASRSRQSDMAALTLALPDERGELHFAGDVGTGFTAGTRRQLLELLEERAEPSPAIDVPTGRSRWTSPTPMHLRRWVRPGLIGEIAYRERTSEGCFRHPSWRGLRPDRGLDDLDPA